MPHNRKTQLGEQIARYVEAWAKEHSMDLRTPSASKMPFLVRIDDLQHDSESHLDEWMNASAGGDRQVAGFLGCPEQNREKALRTYELAHPYAYEELLWFASESDLYELHGDVLQNFGQIQTRYLESLASRFIQTKRRETPLYEQEPEMLKFIVTRCWELGIDPFDETQQWCFHLMVAPSFNMSALTRAITTDDMSILEKTEAAVSARNLLDERNRLEQRILENKQNPNPDEFDIILDEIKAYQATRLVESEIHAVSFSILLWFPQNITGYMLKAELQAEFGKQDVPYLGTILLPDTEYEETIADKIRKMF